jgi:hypothetical protein
MGKLYNCRVANLAGPKPITHGLGFEPHRFAARPQP